MNTDLSIVHSKLQHRHIGHICKVYHHYVFSDGWSAEISVQTQWDTGDTDTS